MKKILIVLFSLFISREFIYSQVDLGMPVAAGKGGVATAMVKDWEALGVNPSNLGWSSNHLFSIGLLNWGINMQSKALDFKTMRQAYLNPEDTFSSSDKQKYAQLFTSEDGLNFQSHINWIALSFAIPNVGGFALNLRDRVSGHVGLNASAADILFNGYKSSVFSDTSVYKKKMSEVFEGTDLDFYHYRELNLAYGRKIIGFGGSDSTAVLYGGVGAKYIWGLADVQIRAKDGELSGQSAISTSYKVNYGTIKNFTPEDVGGLFNAPGKGMAFDLGTSLIIKGKFRLAAAVTDIGKMTWSSNVLMAVDSFMPKPDSSRTGINSWDLSSQGDKLFGGKSILDFAPGTEYTSTLPMRLRVGFGLKIGKLLDIGADFVMPMNDANGNLKNPYMAFGGEIILRGGMKVSTGIAGNKNYGWAVPLGFTIGSLFKCTEFYIATNDIITFISTSKNPQASLAIGVIRVNIK